jgi:penicillin amidase
MKRLRRWLIGIGLVLLVVVVILAGVSAWFVRRPWPQVSGTVEILGLFAPVEILRDRWGIPHIYAENDHDLLFAQGYVHAQDRLWQMEMNRRISSGTLSEILGSATVELDRYVRTLGPRRIAEQSWAGLSEDSRSLLEAYAEGVNAYLLSRHDRLPLEFTLLGVEPEPWTPLDSLAWGNMIALNMGYNHSLELLRARIIATVGEEAARQLLPPFAQDTPIIVPSEAHGYDWLQNMHFEGLAAAEKWLVSPYRNWGSNNWVVHGSRTATGMPILANDTHLDLPMPSRWYENGLHGGRFDSVGFSFPGVPLIVVGRNRHIAWGITNLDPDVQDLYIEKLDDPENPAQYEFEGQWYDLEVIQENIEVKGREPEKLKILLTRHGPILNDMDEIHDARPMALGWTLYEGSLVVESMVQLNLATNWDEFRAALHHWDTLCQNFVYADVAGNIGYQATGRIPIRVSNHQGLLPVPGWTGEYEWQGFIPFDELPSLLNPPAGFIATANNKVVSEDYPYLLTQVWFHPGFRARQITDLLAADDQITFQDVRDIQARTYSLPAEILRPYLLAIGPENDLQADALDRVRAWNLDDAVDQVGASIFETWYLFMVRNTVADELGQEDGDLADQYPLYVDRTTLMLVELMNMADHAWFDDVNTPQVEDRDDIARRSLADAVDWLSERYGSDPDDWTWGQVHTLTFVHFPLGQSGIAPLERLFNSRTIPAAGSLFTINTATYSVKQPFEMIYGTTQRMIVDLSELDHVSAVNTTGQSGHLFHPNRADQIAAWQAVEYHRLPLARQAVEAEASSVLTLVPSGS